MTQPGSVNGAELADRDQDALGGTGGSSGGGARAGRGEPSGGASDRQAGGMLGATPFGAGAGSLAGLDGGGIVAEAAALGAADGSLADAADDREPGAERLSSGPTGAEAIGQGARRGDTGSGTRGDLGDLGGGGGGPARPARPAPAATTPPDEKERAR